MFKHILVPLDGSRLAESVIQPALFLAGKLNSRVTLIHIIEESAPQKIHGEFHIKNVDEAKVYLEKIAGIFQSAGIKVEVHVHTAKVDNVARSMAEHSSEIHHDLIILCTHGESGWQDFVIGSIAQQVIGFGKLPVLLVHPIEKETPSKGEESQFSRFLLALDGDLEHEAGVEKSILMAEILKAELHLLTVVETMLTLSGSEAATGILMPSATKALLELAEEDAIERLNEKAVELRKTGFTVTYDVHRGDPVQWIVKDALTHQCDLIVLGTHGKSGLNAFWSGSSAPKIPSLTKINLLLIPVHHLDDPKE
jgi:nucleotide-binding universal stress UspA family protein